jgi:putative cardiolipin synthase
MTSTVSGTDSSDAIAPPPSTSGIHSLPDGAEAFAARMALAAEAEQTIDAQYYMWHSDLAGTLLFAQLARAADRGVKVRLLLDDNNTKGQDATLAALDFHPNIEVRLFNPFRRRSFRGLDYLFEWGRTNRRMHNKSFTVDTKATILGGRNVGDEYFGAGREISFEDLDVLAVGPLVADVTAVFEQYWDSESAVPVRRLLRRVTRTEVADIVAKAELLEASEPARRYIAAVRETRLAHDLKAGKLEFEFAVSRLISDPPSKVLGHRRGPVAPVLDRLQSVLGSADTEIDLISPYFVPTRRGVAALMNLASRKVKIRVLTNSLAATDVAAVHAGYARYRRPLLDGGVTLFEMTPTAVGLGTGKRGMRMGSSGASLHAKAFAVDRCRAYVGSFNFDPRSARLNTEMGVVIESPVIASRLAARLDEQLPRAAYRLELDGRGLEWIALEDGGERRYRREPGASLGRRLMVWLLSWLPIEGYL